MYVSKQWNQTKAAQTNKLTDWLHTDEQDTAIDACGPGHKRVKCRFVRGGKHPPGTRIRSAIDVPAAGQSIHSITAEWNWNIRTSFLHISDADNQNIRPDALWYVHRHCSLIGLYWRNNSPLNWTAQYHLFLFSFSLLCFLVSEVHIFDLNRKYWHYIFG